MLVVITQLTIILKQEHHLNDALIPIMREYLNCIEQHRNKRQ